MGCGVSKIDGIFFRRVQEIRNQTLLKDPTYSKKELLLHDRDVSVHRAMKPEDPMEKEPKKTKEMPRDHKNGENVLDDSKDHETIENTEKSVRENGKYEKENEFEDAWTDADNEDENEDDERMIGHGDDGNFPGSPSFRVYFKEDEEDDEHDGIGKSDAFKDKALREDAISSKESLVDKKAISGRKKGSFRKVLPKGLSMKSCYTSPRSNPDHAHLLIEKT